jgi:hypothetical protein
MATRQRKQAKWTRLHVQYPVQVPKGDGRETSDEKDNLIKEARDRKKGILGLTDPECMDILKRAD